LARKVSEGTLRRRVHIDEKDRQKRAREDAADKVVEEMVQQSIERHGP